MTFSAQILGFRIPTPTFLLKGMRISTAIIYSVFYAAAIFALSLIFLPYYIGGDQLYYIKSYNDMYLYDNIFDAYEHYKLTLSAAEPLHFILGYYFSPYIDKNILVSVLNSILAFVLSKWMIDKKVNPIIIIFSMLNYYLWVVFLPAERLKLGLLFALLALLSESRHKYTFYLLSILSHFQSVVIIISAEISRVRSLSRDIYHYSNVLKVLALIIPISILAIIFHQHIYMKIVYYFDNYRDLKGVLKPLTFMAATMFYVKNDYLKVILLFIPVIFASLIVGSDRLTMIAYFIFMYFALQYKEGLNLGVMIITTYFSVKGIIFLNTIVEHGDGFYNG